MGVIVSMNEIFTRFIIVNAAVSLKEEARYVGKPINYSVSLIFLFPSRCTYTSGHHGRPHAQVVIGIEFLPR